MEPLFLAGIAGVLGVIAVNVWRHTAKGRASRSWPATEAEILSSEPVRECGGMAGSVHTVWVPHIRYAYSVRGAAYEGTRIAFSSALYTSFPDRAQATCDAYPAGKTVLVYFDPADPSSCTLERAATSGIPGYAASALIGAASLGIFYFLLSLHL